MERKNIANETATVNFNESSETTLARTIMQNATRFWNKIIAVIPIKLMQLDISYQRQLSTNIDKLVTEWDSRECKNLLVSYRDGVFYVLDGQHRMAAAQIKGITELPCEILTGLTREDEALIFARQNRNVKKLYPFDVYKANLACGNKEIPEVWVDMEIARICDAYNVEVRKISSVQTNPKILRSITGARKVVQYNGSPCFDWIIKTITSSNWNMCKEAYAKCVINMLKNFYIDNVGRMPHAEEKLRGIISKCTPMELITMAKHDYPKYGTDTALNLTLKALMQ